MALLNPKTLVSLKSHPSIRPLITNFVRSLKNMVLISPNSPFPVACSTGFASNVSHTSGYLPVRHFHVTSSRCDVMEFFDDPKNWGAKFVRTGRPWMKDDLRLKSNTDIHKLWFILYKERNMLYTMQEEYERISELFPHPERIDKVEESMRNLQEVVEERNRAVKLLELGITGEAPKRVAYSGLGRRYVYTYQQHLMPYWRNARHFARRFYQEPATGTTRRFLLRLWAKNRKERYQEKRKQIAILAKAREEYPDDEVWQAGLNPSEIKLTDVYHGKMSD